MSVTVEDRNAASRLAVKQAREDLVSICNANESLIQYWPTP